MLAESLSDKPLFYCDPRISEPIAEIRGKLEGKIDHLQDIQEICDETIALKEDLRKTKRSEKLSPDLVSRVDSAVSTFEEKNKELKADGIYVEYDKYPELKKKWEIARDGVNTINTNFGYAGAIAGGVAGFVGSLLVNRFLMPSADRIARRALTRENRALRAHASDPEGDDSDLEIDD